MHFRLKTHTFLSVFILRPHYNAIENGGVCQKNLSPGQRFLKTESNVLVWTRAAENEGFRKHFVFRFRDRVWTFEHALKTLGCV